MKVRRGASSEAKVEQQMTPMIDVVFQLLTFFIMSFKVVQLEGDFNIKMPQGATRPGAITDNTVPPMKLRLTAKPNGDLNNMKFNDTDLGSNGWDKLRSRISDLVGTASGPGSIRQEAEVELDCDYNLKYDYVIKAIDSVSGYRDGSDIIRLVEKVKFAPPKARPDGA